MNSISQKYSLEFNNCIKNKIFNSINEIGENILLSILKSTQEKYLNFVSTIEENIKNLILNIIKETISFFDEKFRNSDERKKLYHINIFKDERNLKTIWGDIVITRTYYESKDRKQHFYFIDELLGLNKYDRYDPIYKSIAIDLAIKTNQKLAGELTGKFTTTIKDNLTSNTPNFVPRQTIYNWIKRWQIPMVSYPPIEIDGNTLYVMGDEKYIHEQIKNNVIENDANEKKIHHKIMSKCFVTFSGIEQHGKRRILKDRMVFITSSTSPWNNFLNQVTKVYDFEKIENIVFLSDGGRWLTSGAYDLKMYPHNTVTLCLCEFHARQDINRITTNEDYRKLLNDYINSNDKKSFVELMKYIKKEKEQDEARLKKIVEYEKYIINNWKKIQNTFNSECRSSMESHISHCIASYFSSRPKAYSKNTIEDLLKLVEAKINGIDIQRLYLKSYKNSESISIENEELNFSILETSNSSNIPIIENSCNSTVFQKIFRLAHNN